MGFLAAAKGDTGRAEIIFGALQRLRAQRAFPHVGLAIAYMNAGRHEDAARLLERVLPGIIADDLPELQAFRGLALQLAGRHSESRRALQAAGANRLAQNMLGECCTAPQKETQ